VQDPTSFSNFTNSSGGQQLARNFASGSGEGNFCIPLDLSNTGISGVADGANVTIQFVYNGGDGTLYQVSLRAAFLPHIISSTEFLFFSYLVRGLDIGEQLCHPVQYLLHQFYLLDEQWRKWNRHDGLCWRARFPGSTDRGLSGMRNSSSSSPYRQAM
jgi:hypothetical protein